MRHPTRRPELQAEIRDLVPDVVIDAITVHLAVRLADYPSRANLALDQRPVIYQRRDRTEAPTAC